MNDTPKSADPAPEQATPDTVEPPVIANPGVQPAGAEHPVTKGSGSGWWIGLLIILLLLLLVGGGFAGWYGWQQWNALHAERDAATGTLATLRGDFDTLASQVAAVDARQSDLARGSERRATELSSLQARIDDSLELVSRINEQLSGGRVRFELSAVEQLLLLANDRLQLDRDAVSALAALDSADRRLAALADPQLFKVREALARERAALRAVPRPDLASAALSLSSLIDGASRLPLAAHSPTTFSAPEPRGKANGNAPQAPGWQRAWSAIQTAARNLFVVRRDADAQRLRLLPPEAEGVIYHVLILKLEGARAALLSGRTVPMREALVSASAWLDAEFKADDAAVIAVQAELRRLQQLELTPPLPDISGSLVELRERLDMQRLDDTQP